MTSGMDEWNELSFNWKDLAKSRPPEIIRTKSYQQRAMYLLAHLDSKRPDLLEFFGSKENALETMALRYI